MKRQIVSGIFVFILAVSAWAQTPVQTAADTAIPGSLTLEEAVNLAYNRNPDIKTQQETIKVAKAQYVQSRADWLLKVDLTVEDMHVDNAGATVSDGLTGNELFSTIEASQPVLTFGKFENATKGAKAYFQNQEALMDSVRQSIRYQVTAAYYNVLLQDALAKVNEEALKIAEDHLKQAQVRFDQGVNTEFDVTRAKVDVANAKTDYITASNNLIKAKQSLNQLFHLPPDSEIQLKDSLQYAAYKPVVDKLWDTAKVHRPELVSKQLVVKQYESYLGLRKSQFFPTVSVGGSYSWYRNDIDGYDTRDYDTWSSYVKMSLNLFEGLKTKGQIDEAKALLQQSKLSYDKALLNAQTEVEQTVREIIKQQELVASTSESVSLAEISLKMAKVAYENGRATTLDVSDAELSLTSAKVNKAQAVSGYLTAMAKLKQAIGTDELPE
jgi:outer membrane protein TolC